MGLAVGEKCLKGRDSLKGVEVNQSAENWVQIETPPYPKIACFTALTDC